jgi:Ser/Thr protein kinase RdoA (MazF antagonist)
VLARYHRLVAGFDDPLLHLSYARYHPDTLEAIVARLIGDRDRLSRRQRGIAERLRRHAAEIQARLAGFDLLPSLVIHGDYYSGNLIFRDNKIVGVLDYDLAHWAPRVVEVAEALIYFAREDLRRTRGAPRFRHIVYAGWVDLDLVSRFIAAYRQEGELTPAEIRALPDVMRLIWLSASLSPPLRPRLRMDRDAEALTEVLTLADWARENSQALSSALRARSYG